MLSALLAGPAAAGAVLVSCMAVALGVWFALDQGTHGSTTDAIRLGSDSWLLAHGSALDVGTVTITVIPLGLLALAGHVCYRFGRWAGTTSAREDRTSRFLAMLVFAASYALVALVTAILAAVPTAEPSLPRSFTGAFLLALVFGGAGLLAGADALTDITGLLPAPVHSALLAGAVGALAVFIAGAALFAISLALDLNAAATVLSGLHADTTAAALLVILTALVAPNLALFGAAYLVGPGFTVGTGTSVTVVTATLGPLPAYPPAAALPAEGAAPGWHLLFLLVPVFCGVYAGHLQARRHPEHSYTGTALQALAGGIAGALLLGIAWLLCGGAIGPGRMTDLGVDLGACIVAAALALGIGGVVGAVLTRWRVGPPELQPDGTEVTVVISPDPTGSEPTVTF